MAIVTKEYSKCLIEEIEIKTAKLIKALKGRPLINNKEGCPADSSWTNSKDLVFIKKVEAFIAALDFRSILTEIEKWKSEEL